MLPKPIHNTFTIERTYPATAARVFHAFKDPAQKRRWFADGAGFVIDSYENDFRVGGFERTRFRFGADGPPMTNDCVYFDIVENERLIFAYSMTIGGTPLSTSLATVEIVAASGSRTLLQFTEHTIYLDGNDGSVPRREGTVGLFERLARELDAGA
jgi:uncharacterized protein YndB with AHSA1/START domain